MQNKRTYSAFLACLLGSACGGASQAPSLGAPGPAHPGQPYESDSSDAYEEGESEVAEGTAIAAGAPMLAQNVATRSVPTPVSPQTKIAAATGGDRYQTLAENSYTKTAQEDTSTFSIDVDTASYSNIRRYLRANQLPPASAVRTEELINYFNYDYQGPSESDPFSIHTELSPAPWHEKHQLLKVGLQGYRMDTADLPARNLVFLIDTSGSMSSHDKLGLLKQGFGQLTQSLREEDHVSIVAYAGSAGVVLAPTSGADKQTITAALDNLSSGGSTNGGQGIELAYRLAAENFNPNAINRIILASDGDFNVGMTSKNALIELVEKKRKHGTYLSVLGFGRGNLNDATMEQIADKGNGNYSYIDSAAEARKVLVDEGGSTLVTIAKDVKIQVQFNSKAVESYRLIGYENRVLANKDFDNDKVDAGELGPGHSVTALYEVVPRKGAHSQKPVSIRLRYKRPNQTKSKLLVHQAKAAARGVAEPSRDMRFASAVAGFGMLLSGSAHKGTLNWADLQAMAEDAVGSDSSVHRQEFLELIGIAAGLSRPEAQVAR